MRARRPSRGRPSVDKSCLTFGIEAQHRDRDWLDALRLRRCLITGLYGTEADAVDPVHIGTAGKGLKVDDRCALPLLHSVHRRMHAEGEITVLRELAPDDLLRQAFRALAREMYREERR